MKIKKRINLFLMTLLFLMGSFSMQCGDSELFYNLDFSFHDIEDVFPKSFHNQEVSLIKDGPSYNKQLKFKEYRIGLYGSEVSLEIWESKSSNDAKSNWNKMYALEKKRGFIENKLVKSTEYRASYTTKDNYKNILWTNKMFLFKITAKVTDKNPNIFKDFLNNSKIAKIK